MVVAAAWSGFPLVVAVSERDMAGIEPGPLGWHTSAITNELQEVRSKSYWSQYLDIQGTFYKNLFKDRETN